ncbi:MAG: hypothetical protein ACOWW1_05635 [archaeon]
MRNKEIAAILLEGDALAKNQQYSQAKQKYENALELIKSKKGFARLFTGSAVEQATIFVKLALTTSALTSDSEQIEQYFNEATKVFTFINYDFIKNVSKQIGVNPSENIQFAFRLSQFQQLQRVLQERLKAIESSQWGSGYPHYIEFFKHTDDGALETFLHSLCSNHSSFTVKASSPRKEGNYKFDLCIDIGIPSCTGNIRFSQFEKPINDLTPSRVQKFLENEDLSFKVKKEIAECFLSKSEFLTKEILEYSKREKSIPEINRLDFQFNLSFFALWVTDNKETWLPMGNQLTWRNIPLFVNYKTSIDLSEISNTKHIKHDDLVKLLWEKGNLILN